MPVMPAAFREDELLEVMSAADILAYNGDMYDSESDADSAVTVLHDEDREVQSPGRLCAPDPPSLLFFSHPSVGVVRFQCQIHSSSPLLSSPHLLLHVC